MRLAQVWLMIVCGWVFCGNSFSQRVTSLAPDTIFYGGKIVTVDPSFEIRQAFAVREEKFLAVGSDAQMLRMTGPKTRKINLRGLTVIPGLMDDHDHVYAAAMAARGVDVVGVTSVAEMLERIRRAVSVARPGQVVFTSAGWTFPLAPTQDDLDRISSDIPIIVPRLGRGAPILNTAALQLAGAKAGAMDSTALAQLIPPLTNEEEEELILKTQREKNAEGLTSIRDLNIDANAMRAYFRLWRQGKLTLRTGMGLRPADGDNMEQVLKTSGMGNPFGDHWLRLDSISEAPSPMPGSPFVHAMMVVNQLGWRPAPHLCDRGCGRPGEYESLDLALEAYEAADRGSSIREKRWVVEHIPTVQPDQMDRLARLRVVVSAQFQPYKWGSAEYDRMVKTMGKAELAERQVPMRELLDHHLRVGAGSDSHGMGQIDNPLVPIYFYVTRKTENGRVLDPKQKISRQEALRASTIENAYLTFEETMKGSIEAGKLADFVILSQDLLTVPEDKILSIHPLATYVGGRKVFSARESEF